MQLWGVDFSSAPSARKPIVVAQGVRAGAVLRLQSLRRLPRMADFEVLLQTPGPWVGGFDLPFGLPRAFVQAQALGDTAASVIAELHRRCPTRMDFRALVDGWGNTQPAGRRLLHRTTDGAMPGITSTSPLQTRYVPVGFMYYEGFSRLMKAGTHAPMHAPTHAPIHAPMHAAEPPTSVDWPRVALEAYPGLLAHELIGRRSYKNDDSAERLLARKDILEALEQGRTRLALRLKLTPGQAGEVVADASGDLLDAVLCLAQAAWAQAQPGWGRPEGVDPIEGWITSAGAPLPA